MNNGSGLNVKAEQGINVYNYLHFMNYPSFPRFFFINIFAYLLIVLSLYKCNRCKKYINFCNCYFLSDSLDICLVVIMSNVRKSLCVYILKFSAWISIIGISKKVLYIRWNGRLLKAYFEIPMIPLWNLWSILRAVFLSKHVK